MSIDSYQNIRKPSESVRTKQKVLGSDPACPQVIHLRQRFFPPNPLSVFTGILTALVSSYGFLAASRLLEAVEIFLFTNPSLPDANMRIATAANSVVVTLGRAIIVFSIACLIALACNRRYMRPTLQGISLVIVAYCCWIIAAIGLVFWTKMGKRPEMPLIYTVLSGIGGFTLARKSSHIFASAKQHMLLSADDVIRRTSYPPILYLRSFTIDTANAPENYELTSREFDTLKWQSHVWSQAFWTERREWTFEEIICKGFTFVSPVVAIGQPGERLPMLGAARKYVANSEWQQEVIRLLSVCRFACLVIGSSKGLLWEFQQTLASCLPHQILLIVPPGAPAQTTWTSFAQEVKNLSIPIFLPDTLPASTLAVVFTNDWEPIIITGRPLICNYRQLALGVIQAKWYIQ